MNTKLVDSLVQIIQSLSTEERTLLEVRLNTQIQQKQQFQQWEQISDEQAATLKAEFAEEDRALAEAALPDYFFALQREDEA